MSHFIRTNIAVDRGGPRLEGKLWDQVPLRHLHSLNSNINVDQAEFHSNSSLSWIGKKWLNFEIQDMNVPMFPPYPLPYATISNEQKYEKVILRTQSKWATIDKCVFLVIFGGHFWGFFVTPSTSIEVRPLFYTHRKSFGHWVRPFPTILKLGLFAFCFCWFLNFQEERSNRCLGKKNIIPAFDFDKK